MIYDRILRSASNTLFSTLSLTSTLLLGEINVGPTLWKWDPHKVVGPTLISPNKRVSVRESVASTTLGYYDIHAVNPIQWETTLLLNALTILVLSQLSTVFFSSLQFS